MEVSYIGINELEGFEKPTLNKLVDEYSKKISRDIQNGKIIMTIKKYKKAGNRVKYSLHCRIDSPNIIAVATASDWDFPRTLHKVFNKVRSEIEHKFKTEGKEKYNTKRIVKGIRSRRKK